MILCPECHQNKIMQADKERHPDIYVCKNKNCCTFFTPAHKREFFWIYGAESLNCKKYRDMWE